MSTSCGTSRKYAIPEKGKKKENKGEHYCYYSVKQNKTQTANKNNTTNNVYESLPYKKVEMLSSNCPK